MFEGYAHKWREAIEGTRATMSSLIEGSDMCGLYTFDDKRPVELVHPGWLDEVTSIELVEVNAIILDLISMVLS